MRAGTDIGKSEFSGAEMRDLPAGWKVRPLGDVADFLDGRRRPVKDSDRARMRGDVPYYGASGIVDYVRQYLFDEPLILLSEDGENILSRNTRLAFKIEGRSWVNNHAHVLRPKDGFSLDYLAEYLESLDYEQYNTGTAQPKLNKLVCSGIPVLCPPPNEQRAIAEALSEVDALLARLDRLIAKKRDLKQAAMQQLLTGRIRLPGFADTWTTTSLSELAEIVSGGTPATSEPTYWNGDIKWCTPSDITASPGKYLRDTARSISALGLRSSGARLLPAGALLLCSRATIGELKIAAYEVCTNQGFKSLLCRPRVNNEFLYYKLLTMKAQMIERAFGSTFLEISTANVAALALAVPSLREQSAIAEVLSGIDEELVALEARRAKTHALKQAMMQELLTGRIRLI